MWGLLPVEAGHVAGLACGDGLGSGLVGLAVAARLALLTGLGGGGGHDGFPSGRPMVGGQRVGQGHEFPGSDRGFGVGRLVGGILLVPGFHLLADANLEHDCDLSRVVRVGVDLEDLDDLCLVLTRIAGVPAVGGDFHFVVDRPPAFGGSYLEVLHPILGVHEDVHVTSGSEDPCVQPDLRLPAVRRSEGEIWRGGQIRLPRERFQRGPLVEAPLLSIRGGAIDHDGRDAEVGLARGGGDDEVDEVHGEPFCPIRTVVPNPMPFGRLGEAILVSMRQSLKGVPL